MGHEFIPFSTMQEAENFKKEHRGEKILRFDEITKEQVYKLDNRINLQNYSLVYVCIATLNIS